MPNLPPVQTLETIFPTRTEISRVCGLDKSAITRWDIAGAIPQKHWPTLIYAARARGCKLTIEQLAGLRL